MSDDLAKMIQHHEGCITIPYQDSLGIWTVGFGHNMSKPLSAKAIQQIFEDDLNDAINDCLHAFPWFYDLSLKRQHVLVDMCFNMGISRLQHFKKFLAACEAGEYETAADEMLDSVWAQQVKSRAIELAAVMRGSTDI